MAIRTLLVAELASNHSGQWNICEDMIKSAADHGADWVKLQLYDASVLHKDDPQKAWLTECQVSRPVLERMIKVSERSGVKITASVFGIGEAMLASACGLKTIKIGSGDSAREDLASFCEGAFHTVWKSYGLSGPRPEDRSIPFYGVSQYPTPYLRGLARLKQSDKSGVWGWSDHGENLEVAKEAMLEGATYLERHYSLGVGRGCRWSAWDTSYDQLKELRLFAEDCSWEGSKAHGEAVAQYIGRWGA